MFKIAIGHSEEADTAVAIKDVLEQCQTALGDVSPNAGLVFASTSYDHPLLLKEILAKYPGIQLSGCSSYGEISSKITVSEDSIALLLLASDQIKQQAGSIEDISNDSNEKSSESISKSLKDKIDNPALCLLFADGILGNVSRTLEGLQSHLGANFPIVGGNACDDWKFEKVYQFHNDSVRTGSASYLVFSEPLKTSSYVNHGRTPFDSTRSHIITKSDKNFVYMIDDMPALKFYESEIGPLHSFETYALLISQKGSDKYIIRSPFRVNKEDGSIFFAGDVPENAQVQISKLSTPAETLAAADTCVKNAIANFKGKKIELAFIFSCALRKEILGTETVKEIELIKKQLPENTPIFGFYTFGEIGPIDHEHPSMYHNETIVVSLIGN